MHDPRTVIFRRVRQLTSLRHGTLPAYQRMRFQLAPETALAELSEAQRATVATVWDGARIRRRPSDRGTECPQWVGVSV